MTDEELKAKIKNDRELIETGRKLRIMVETDGWKEIYEPRKREVMKSATQVQTVEAIEKLIDLPADKFKDRYMRAIMEWKIHEEDISDVYLAIDAGEKAAKVKQEFEKNAENVKRLDNIYEQDQQDQ